MLTFSANLGFLWNHLPLPEAIHKAKAAGFDAVECHWPYQTPASDVLMALKETGLPMLGLNTIRGKEGENGLSALPGREQDAKSSIDQALAYAKEIKALNVHVMAGVSSGSKAYDTFLHNLDYACTEAQKNNITILIEPLNRYDAPGYFLKTSEQAKGIIEDLKQPNLKLMFDCYHLQISEGDITRRLETLLPLIGHIQVASVPHRQEPDQGELSYTYIYERLIALGYNRPIGAEYKPAAKVEAGLGWLKKVPHFSE